MSKLQRWVMVVLCACGLAAPALAQDPWDTQIGQMCFEQWIRDTEQRVNGLDDPKLNDRKPWYINEYGLWASRTPYGPSSPYAPDNFGQYRNKYHYMWVEYYAVPEDQTSGMRPIFRRLNIPDLRQYVLDCIARAGGTVSGAGGGAGAATVDSCGQRPTGAAPASLLGQWEFGRTAPTAGRLCTLTLKAELGEYGYAIQSCNLNESFWRMQGNELWFCRNDGKLTSRLQAVGPERWEGPYVLDPKVRVTHYLARTGGTAGTAATGGAPAGAALEPGVDRPGGDYRGIDFGPEQCREACDRDPQCRAWTFVKPGLQGEYARCWLKSSVPAATRNAGTTSGVKAGR